MRHKPKSTRLGRISEAHVEKAKTDLIDMINENLVAKDIMRSQLADLIGMQRQHVTNFLNRSPDMRTFPYEHVHTLASVLKLSNIEKLRMYRLAMLITGYEFLAEFVELSSLN